ncbi:MAG TPA: hypothetical protein VMV69_06365 [Pirellulales bacterium]|nr:hypothetical protein [Pirellulales bacterium]
MTVDSFPSPNDERFNRKEAAGTPLMSAVEELCRRNPGYTPAGMEQMTLGEIVELARETYGDRLPEFWRIWNDWNQPGLEQPMGDL